MIIEQGQGIVSKDLNEQMDSIQRYLSVIE